MKRILPSLVLFAGIAVLAGSVSAQTGPPAVKISYIDRTKKGNPVIEEVPGTIVDENATVVKFKPKVGKDLDLPAGDVVDVIYELGNADIIKVKPTYNAALKADKDARTKTGKDRQGLLENARSGYQKMLDEHAAALPKAGIRNLEFKIAHLTLSLSTYDKTQEDKAVKLLTGFRDKYADAWQLSNVLERLADLQYARGDYKAAAKSYEEILTKIKGLSEDSKKKYQMAAADALVKAEDYPSAVKRLNDILSGLKKEDPQYFPLQMRLLKCKAADPAKVQEAINDLQKVIKDTKEEEKYKKAVAHNTLGDCFLLTKKPEDVNNAQYEFLYVDVWYAADKQETMKAYSELIKIYEKLRRPARVKEYQEKLEKLKGR